MKTIQIFLIATFLTFSTAGFIKAGSVAENTSKNVINMTFSQAVQVPGLVLAMYQQLGEGFLRVNKQYYTVSVYYMNHIVNITGTYDQWSLFFHNNWKFKNDYKVIEIDK